MDPRFEEVLQGVIDRAQDLTNQSEKTARDHQRLLATNAELNQLIEELRKMRHA